MKIEPSRNGKITLSFIDIGKSCLSCKFFTSLICLLMLLIKIKFSQKFQNLQYKLNGRRSCKKRDILPHIARTKYMLNHSQDMYAKLSSEYLVFMNAFALCMQVQFFTPVLCMQVFICALLTHATRQYNWVINLGN